MGRLGRGAALLLMGLAAAGCVSLLAATEPDAPAGTGVGVDARRASVPAGASGCSESAVTLPVEMAHARGLLPEGFEPSEAYGVPERAGFAMAGILTARCEFGEISRGPFGIHAVGVWIEDPRIPGGPEGADFDVYVLETATDDRALLDHLRAVGWAASPAEIDVTVSDVGPALLADGSARDAGGGESVRISVATTRPFEPTGFALYWHVGPHGPVFQEFFHEARGSLGAARCAFAPDTTAARVAGMQSCPDGQGYRATDLAWRGNITLLPMARA